MTAGPGARYKRPMALAEFFHFAAYLLITLGLLRIIEAWASHSGHGTLASGVGWFIGV